MRNLSKIHSHKKELQLSNVLEERKSNFITLHVIKHLSVRENHEQFWKGDFQGCDCTANWLILANSDPSFVISEISVCKLSEKMFPCMGIVVFTIQEQSYICYNCRRFLCILANLASGQFHHWILVLCYQDHCYRPRSEGDNRIGSVRPSVCLSVRLSVCALTAEPFDLWPWYLA